MQKIPMLWENSSPSVSTMKLNLLEAPLGVDKENLSFSWAMEDGDMDEYQTAYQIVVGTTEAAIKKASSYAIPVGLHPHSLPV